MSKKNSKPILVIGARFDGHAAVVESIISSSTNFWIFGYLDDDPDLSSSTFKNKKVLGNISLLNEIYNKHSVRNAIVAIGDNIKREEYINKLVECGYEVPSIIHKSSWIAEDATIGKGCVLAPASVIMNSCKIGDGVTINTGTTIDHNCVLEGYDNISPGSHLSGRVYVEKYVFMGTGTIIIPDIKVGQNSYIGAGTVVIKDVVKNSKVAGVPARNI